MSIFMFVYLGVDGPLMSKVSGDLVAKERKIADGIIPRETFVDRVVSKEPEADE